MTHPIFGWPSYRKLCTFSGGSWTTAYPASHLGELPLSRAGVTVDSDPASTKFIATFSTTVWTRLLGFVGHTAGRGDTFTMRFYRDAARTTLVHTLSDELFWLRPFGKGSVPYGDPRWFQESFTTAEIEATPVKTRPVVLEQALAVQAIEVDVDVTASGKSDFRLGLFATGLGVEVEETYDYGARLGVEQRVKQILGAGGVAHYTDDAEPLTWAGTFSHIGHSQAMSHFFELRRGSGGRGEPFLFVAAPDEPRTWLQEAFLAELDPQAMPEIERAYADKDAIALALRQAF